MASAPGPAAPAGPSVQLVSITLSPVTPARTDVLVAAASILRQRAAQLHLPSIRAQISGANVVLTGPAADETQLKTLTQAGVVNLRQVLLYQPSAGAPTYGDASLVNHDTLALFGELVCTPANASTWKGQVGYNVAGAYDNPDTQIVSCDSSGGKYALDVATVQDTQISNATAELPTTSNQQEVMLTFNRAGASAFGTLTSHLFSTYASGPGLATAMTCGWMPSRSSWTGTWSRHCTSKARSGTANSRLRTISPGSRPRSLPLNCAVVPCRRISGSALSAPPASYTRAMPATILSGRLGPARRPRRRSRSARSCP
jgi:hypothetical protein